MKRFLSIITVISMLFSMTVYAQSTSDNSHELDLSGYENFIQMLADIDINIPVLELDSSLKKGDFLKSLSAFFGYSQMTSSYETAQSIYDGDISVAYALGWIDDKESLNAEESITLKEAAKCMLNALGYNVKLELIGSTDENYYREAVSLGLKDGITSGWEDSISYAQMLKMLYNALDINMIISDMQNGFSEEGTVLYERHDIELLKGIVTANKQSSLAGQPCGANSIEIDGAAYECADQLAHTLLGRYVYCLKREDVILHVSAPAKRNTVTVVQNDDIEDFSSLKEITYFNENDKIKKLKFEYPPTVLVNGTLKTISSITELKNLMGQNGELEAVDNDNDGNYEILKVTNYITYVADMINYSKDTIIDQHINKIIELDRDKYELTFIKDGNAAAFSDIKVGDVIEISADKELITETGERLIDYENSEYITVIISSSSIGGIVNWFDSEKLSVDESEFEISDYFNKAVKDGLMENIHPGMSGAFYVNHSGKIVYVNTAANVLDKYGFLVWGDYVQEYGRVCIKVYTSEGEVKLFELADKVRVDGTWYNSNEKFLEIDQLFADIEGKCKIKNQLVIYRLNKDNRMSYIDTALVTSENENEDTALTMDVEFYDLGVASDTLLSGGKYNSYGNVYTNGSYKNMNIKAQSEKLFVVSGFENKEAHDKLQITSAANASKNFEITTSSYFGTGDYSFNDGKCIMFYNVGDDNTAEYMVYYNPLLSENTLFEVSDSSNAAFYVDKGLTMNKNDEVTDYIRVFMPGEQELKTLVCKNQNVLENIEVTSCDGGADLRKGDIIRYNLTASGEVSAIKRDVDFSIMQASVLAGEEPQCFNAPEDIGSPSNYETLVRWLGTRSTTYFTLMSRKSNWSDISISQAAKIPVYRGAFKGTANVLIYDVNADEFINGTLNDLFTAAECGENASVVYVRHTVSNASIILAYNFM